MIAQAIATGSLARTRLVGTITSGKIACLFALHGGPPMVQVSMFPLFLFQSLQIKDAKLADSYCPFRESRNTLRALTRRSR